ncbi:exo-beta-N-acetylmuramidase NamZ family protein [Siphonobacter aquaeclarae]|uniref:Uncharacterized conserved protein YbbC, DUF1343 family n=1 Tax=Siphonobacter aquaeclarae TaxID=563176 RepID=A0A1G9UCA3_9BACT|nr:DUF1343 domain-containing protein [Siphonobacter aquaeclarae]SDM57453.1 Uncharacterized conserved protein YbbC, DUF1343 family [Siphonobacter aquaeclarae]
MVSFRTTGALALFIFLLSLTRIWAAGPVLGIERTGEYLPLLKGKSVGLVVNHTSVFPNRTHLADSLRSLGVKITVIFGPEHGFRGKADAGEHVSNAVDARTGIPVVSLYGSHQKPTAEDLKPVDILLFDIQDVGARFYTYTSTMHYVMEAAAENGKPVIVLDRPNPIRDFVDGPVLDRRFASFVGLNPVPLAHGCTVAELARMINGEGWLKEGRRCNLTTVSCLSYSHSDSYILPVPPSPNLPNQQSVRLYTSLCLFEGTAISVGRGTDTQFQVIGGTSSAYGSYSFTPEDKPGAMNPLHKGKVCYGLDLRKEPVTGFTLRYLIDFYQKSPDKSAFITRPKAFDQLAGTDQLRQQLLAGKSEAEIRASWEPALSAYKQLRKKYLLYP